MAKDITIKEVVVNMIDVYMKNTYHKSSINLDHDTISKSLEDYTDNDLFCKALCGNFEDFMADLLNDNWYQIGAKNCKVTFKKFTDFMNTNKIQNVLLKYNISWIDCLYSVLMNNHDICEDIYRAINPINEVIDKAKEYRILRVQENAIEIALNCYKEIYDKTSLPRDVIISKIQDWAEQAEQEWENGNHNGEYLDFIDEFTKVKKEAFLDEWMNDNLIKSCDNGSSHTNKVSVKLNVDVTFDVDGDVDEDAVKNLARQMVSDKLEFDLNTCYGSETYVDYSVDVANDVDKTYNADMARLLGQKYAKEYTLDGTSRCTYEEVAEAIETAINDFAK